MIGTGGGRRAGVGCCTYVVVVEVLVVLRISPSFSQRQTLLQSFGPFAVVLRRTRQFCCLSQLGR